MATKRLPATPIEESIDDVPFVDEASIVSPREDDVVESTEEEVTTASTNAEIPKDDYVDPTTLTTSQLEQELARRNKIEQEKQEAMLEEYKKLGVKEYTRKKLELQEKKSVFIPFDLGEGVRRDRFGRLVRPVAKVGINGVTYEVPKGMSVDVPVDIAKRIQSSIDSDGIPTTTYGYDLATSPDKDIRKVTAE